MSQQELTANKEELEESFTSYEFWVRNSAMTLALVSGDRENYNPGLNLNQAQTVLLKYLAPIVPEPESLPMFLSPERPEAPAEDTADTGRLIRALYGAATHLDVWVDATETQATVLVVGEKESVPRNYLVSLVKAEAQDFTATTKDELAKIYGRITEDLLNGL